MLALQKSFWVAGELRHDAGMTDSAMVCALCERSERLTRHHLVPRCRHHNKKNKREFDRVTVKKTVGLCRPCHSQLHALFTEKELERNLHQIEVLKNHPEVARFASWIRAKPVGFRVPTRRSERKATRQRLRSRI